MKTPKNPAFSSRSLVQNTEEIESLIPPNPGWNFVEVLNHPLDKFTELTGNWPLS